VRKAELRSQVTFSGTNVPLKEEFNALHDRAHRGYIIANSVADCVTVTVTPTMIVANTE
jgi:organic hydroperoxide reductase OsmC/OhrA